VDSEAEPIRTGQIPDLRAIPLSHLAGQAANGETIVAGVVSRITGGQGDPSRVQVMAFNSAI